LPIGLREFVACFANSVAHRLAGWDAVVIVEREVPRSFWDVDDVDDSALELAVAFWD
jgi:hypothetical protein